jgi:protein-S-isoprenylcysteine O-methyltransferase Ste14
MPEDVLFRLLAIAVTASLFAVSIFYRNRADHAGGRMKRTDEPLPIRAGLSVSGLMGFGGLLLYFVWPDGLAWSMVTVPVWLRWTGVALATIGVAGAFWIFSTLGHNVSRTARTRDNATLVTTGPYRIVRHPLYVNAAIVFAALSMITRSWWFIAWIVPALLLLAVRTRQEEANLEARFGEAWRAYAARTGRFVPRIALMK